MNKSLKDCLLLTALTLTLSALIWLPHYLRLPNFYGLDFSKGFDVIYQNYDGLEYLVIAKSWYNPELIAAIPQSLPSYYFPSHFPGYPIFISLLAPLIGYLKSMLFVSQLFTVLSVLAFYKLVKDFKLTDSPLLLSSIFLILPARWIGVHSVGAAEPVFIYFTIRAFHFYLKFIQTNKTNDLLMTGFEGMFAQLVRPPGILLFIALSIDAAIRYWTTHHSLNIQKIILTKLSYWPLALIPLSLLSVFYLFQIQLGDFWAYFKTGDNIHLLFPPYQVFNINQFWVGDIWLEDLIYIYILGFFAGIKLLKGNLRPVGIFILIYMLAGISITHRDISRYLLPIAPFVLIAYEKVLTSKEFKIVLAVLAIGLYLYTQNFLLNNTAPISNLIDFN